MPQAPYIIGVDLGGTNIRSAVIQEQRILYHDRRPTPATEGPQAVIATILNSLKAVLTKAQLDVSQITAIGVCSPGPLNPRTGIVYEPPNLVGWKDVPLRDQIFQEVQVPVFLGHDATLAGYAEYRYGAGLGVQNMVYMTVSTGIGGGIILDGKLVTGVGGTAGEIGHMYIYADSQAPTCNAGHRGCLEALASGTAIARDARHLLETRRGHGILQAYQHFHKQTELLAELPVTAREVVLAAQQGDAEAQNLLAEAGKYIGIACANIVHFINPQRIVIGGGVTQAGNLLFHPLRAAFASHGFARPVHDVTIVHAQLEDEGGLIGAASYALDMVQH